MIVVVRLRENRLALVDLVLAVDVARAEVGVAQLDRRVAVDLVARERAPRGVVVVAGVGVVRRRRRAPVVRFRFSERRPDIPLRRRPPAESRNMIAPMTAFTLFSFRSRYVSTQVAARRALRHIRDAVDVLARGTTRRSTTAAASTGTTRRRGFKLK